MFEHYAGSSYANGFCCVQTRALQIEMEVVVM